MGEALIDKLYASYRAATSQSGTSSVYLNIGGHVAHLTFAGEALAAAILPSFNHACMEHQNDVVPSLTIYLWDASRVPCFINDAFKQELYQRLNHARQKIDHITTIHLQFNDQGNILSVIDVSKRIAFYFTSDVEQLPDYEISAPMRTIIHWFCRMNQLLFVHGAGIGYQGMGILLVGRGGAGKSTTALLSLLNGFEFIGDDYIAISVRDTIKGYPVYRSAKLTDASLSKLPELKPYQLKMNHENVYGQQHQEKNIVRLDDNIGKLVSSLSLHMMMRPMVAQAKQTSFQSISPMQLLADFAGSTILQMPGCGADMLRELTNICRKLPSYSMRLSQDFNEIAETLKQFIQRTHSEREVLVRCRI